MESPIAVYEIAVAVLFFKNDSRWTIDAYQTGLKLIDLFGSREVEELVGRTSFRFTLRYFLSRTL